MPSGAGQFSLHALGAIAVACPRLRAIGVPALPPVMRVLRFGQVHWNARPFEHWCFAHDFRIADDEFPQSGQLRRIGPLLHSVANARRTTAGSFAITVR